MNEALGVALNERWLSPSCHLRRGAISTPSELGWSWWVREEGRGVPGRETMWTEWWKLKKQQTQVVWLNREGLVESGGSEATEAEEIGCWCSGDFGSPPEDRWEP